MPTQPPIVPSASRPSTYAAEMDAFLAWMTVNQAELVALYGAMGTIAAGGATAIAYTFSSTITDADPTGGFLRLDSATQNASTTIRVDPIDRLGVDWSGVLTTFTASSSVVKGQIRLVKQSDATKWLLFNVTALASPTGYKNISVTCTGSSAANPFTNGDVVILQFTRTGDVGSTGSLNRRTFSEASNATPTPNIASYDMHVITALAANATFAAPTGTPQDGQGLMIRIKDNGTARTLAWNAVYRAASDSALPGTTTISKTMYIGFIYNAADAKWDMVSVLNNI